MNRKLQTAAQVLVGAWLVLSGGAYWAACQMPNFGAPCIQLELQAPLTGIEAEKALAEFADFLPGPAATADVPVNPFGLPPYSITESRLSRFTALSEGTDRALRVVTQVLIWPWCWADYFFTGSYVRVCW